MEYLPILSLVSLAHKHKDIRTRRMAYLTQFSIPALLNPVINKMADKEDVLCLVCRPRSHQSKLHVRFSCAYAYVAGVLTCLHMYLCLCLCLCAGENQALEQPHVHFRR